MSLPIVWTEPAAAQLAKLHDYISESRPVAAENQVAILLNAIYGLAEFPERGRVGRRRGTRELVVSGTSYVVAYRIRIASVRILAIIHGAQRRPRSFKD